MEDVKRKKLVELLEKREHLKAHDLSLRLGNIRLYEYILFKNFRDLMNIITVYEKERGDHILSEYSRALLNYLSSVYSLIKASEYFRDYLQNAEFTDLYQQQINHMEGRGCGALVKGWRNMMIHGKFVPITPVLSFDSDRTYFKEVTLKDRLHYIMTHPRTIFNLKWFLAYVRRRFVIKRSTFEVYIGFKESVGIEKQFFKTQRMRASAKKYLQKLNDIIEVKAVIAEYQEFVIDFYHWFYDTVVELYSKEFNEYRKVEEEIDRFIEKVGLQDEVEGIL